MFPSGPKTARVIAGQRAIDVWCDGRHPRDCQAANQVSKNVSSGVQQTAQMLKDTTGFDVIEMLKGFGSSTPAANTPGTGDGAVNRKKPS
ncbi:hypothetical protein [Arthrobacter sp. D1-17]